MQKILVAILVVICVSILFNAALFAPQLASVGYVLSVGWVIFLVFANWYASAAIFSSNRRNANLGDTGNDGILPGVGIVLFVFSISSFSLLLLFNFGALSLRLHLGLQVSLLAVAAVIVMIQLLAAAAAKAGTEVVYSRSDFLNVARRIRSAVPAGQATEVDRFLEYVEYQMAHPSKMDQEKLRMAMIFLLDEKSSYVERIEKASSILRSF